MEKERMLARRYLEGDCNEIQLNYIAKTEKLDISEVEKAIEELSYHLPVSRVVKLILMYILVHFLFCILYSLSGI